MKKEALILVFAALALTLAATKTGRTGKHSLTDVLSGAVQNTRPVVILDAGHGGEDGGAVAADGTLEKDVNLSVSNGVAAVFELFGVKYIPVRTEDVSVCDEGLSTVRERKRSDILNRFALMTDTPNAIFVSIHQNMYQDSRYWGAQVFYSANHSGSARLAGALRDSILTSLQPDNTREIKPSTDSIYLLYHADIPAVMVECGFLSNPQELSKLQDPVYRAQMSYCVYKGVLHYMNAE